MNAKTSSSTSRLVIKGFAYLFSERFIRLSVGFFVHALVARHLGPERFGEMAYIMKVVGVFATFSLFGVDEIILEHLMRKRLSQDDVFKTALRLRLFSAVIGYVLLAVFLFTAHWGEHERITWALVYGLQIFVLTFSLFDLKFQSDLNFRPLFLVNNLSSLSASALRVLGVFRNHSTYYFLGTYLLGDVILRFAVQWKVGFQFFKGTHDRELAKDIFRSSLPYFLAAFVVLLDQRISFFFIERLLTPVEVGNYSIAVTLVDLWFFIPTAACVTLFPGIIAAFNRSKDEYAYKIQTLAGIVTWSAFVFIIVFGLFSEHIMQLMYGDKYTAANATVKLYALTTIPLFFNLARTKWMALQRNLTDLLGVSLLCMLLNVGLHLVLVARFGVLGAIYSFLLAQLLGNIIYSVFSKDVRASLIILLKTCLFPVNAMKRIRQEF